MGYVRGFTGQEGVGVGVYGARHGPGPHVWLWKRPLHPPRTAPRSTCRRDAPLGLGSSVREVHKTPR